MNNSTETASTISVCSNGINVSALTIGLTIGLSLVLVVSLAGNSDLVWCFHFITDADITGSTSHGSNFHNRHAKDKPRFTDSRDTRCKSGHFLWPPQCLTVLLLTILMYKMTINFIHDLE